MRTSKRAFALGITVPVALGLIGAVLATHPAAAAKQSCQQRYLSCQQRCFKRNADPVPCINRTCNRQFDNCSAGTGKAGFVVRTARPSK